MGRAARRELDVVLVLRAAHLGRSHIAASRTIVALGKLGVTVIAGGLGPLDPRHGRFTSLVIYGDDLVRKSAAALNAKRERGEPIGTVPFGKRISAAGVLEDDPIEQNAIQHVLAQRRTGASYRRIGQELFTKGIASRTGTALTHVQIKRILEKAARTVPDDGA
jgi:hypothetical protein